MQKTREYTIRTMTREEIDTAVEWAATEGWNPGLHDADVFFAADPNGFIIGELDGEPIGCISAVAYGDTFGFMGFYIVKPEYRGKGYGIQLWNRAMEYLKGRNIGLDGVVAQQENYKKSGFKLAYRNVRYEGTGPDKPGEELADLKDIDFNLILEYDAKMFSLPRPEFLEKWINRPKGHAKGIIEKGKLKGYGVIRKCREGYKIGPIFADDAEKAERIYLSLAGKFPGEKIYFDVPEANPKAVTLAEKYNMTKVFETARMYSGNTDVLPVENVYGVTTFELG